MQFSVITTFFNFTRSSSFFLLLDLLPQLFNNIFNSIYPLFQCNINNLHTVLLGHPSRKILGTILKVKRGKNSNKPENKKAHDDAKRLTSRRWIYRLYVSIKEGGRGLVSIEDIIDTSKIRFEDFIKNNMENLIRETRNNISINKGTIARK